MCERHLRGAGTVTVHGEVMAELWVYHRRPSSLVRYRHGGAAAFDPAMRSPLARPVAYSGTPAARDDDKILQFPSPNSRPRRSEKPRPARPEPAKTKKTKKPKKRDS